MIDGGFAYLITNFHLVSDILSSANLLFTMFINCRGNDMTIWTTDYFSRSNVIHIIIGCSHKIATLPFIIFAKYIWVAFNNLLGLQLMYGHKHQQGRSSWIANNKYLASFSWKLLSTIYMYFAVSKWHSTGLGLPSNIQFISMYRILCTNAFPWSLR